MTEAMPTTGAWSIEEYANGEVVSNCLAVISQIEVAAGTTFPVFIPISFRTQILALAGKNYLVKVALNIDSCVHVKIFQDLPCNGGGLTVKGVHYPKTMTDPLEPF